AGDAAEEDLGAGREVVADQGDLRVAGDLAEAGDGAGDDGRGEVLVGVEAGGDLAIGADVDDVDAAGGVGRGLGGDEVGGDGRGAGERDAAEEPAAGGAEVGAGDGERVAAGLRAVAGDDRRDGRRGQGRGRVVEGVGDGGAEAARV